MLRDERLTPESIRQGQVNVLLVAGKTPDILIRRSLVRDSDIHIADRLMYNAKKFRKFLAKPDDRYDVVVFEGDNLSDSWLNGHEGMQLASVIKIRKPDLPVILVSSTLDLETLKSGFNLGIDNMFHRALFFGDQEEEHKGLWLVDAVKKSASK
ncbi:MAG TPA: hypothetical protein VG895_03785 [Patescibacteria group bacterium]|nr:hypothetical protein [Patescibacteria group bacterium]